MKLQKQQIKLFDRLSKTEIIDELHQRAVKFTSTLTKKGFMDILNYEMHGISTPTLCIMVWLPKQQYGGTEFESLWSPAKWVFAWCVKLYEKYLPGASITYDKQWKKDSQWSNWSGV